ncbi:alpha/beta fold hydrolase [Nocardia sp. 2]|uniref:Alpha/beta fold hydrolase n=2 Tax=Nocardia acididurans TaxID=2802282 RepID=A0ABS1MDU2_9NOCA|nr:alpha/beta fold hydrolase [Nocardia acididurans]
MNYRIWRVDDDVTAVLVFLHGIGQCSADYHRYGRAMNRHGIEVWGLDHPGHGLSEGEPDTLPPIPHLVANAEILLSMARAARPTAPLVLAGHSLGAGVALLAMHANGPGAQEVCALALTGTPSREVIMELPGPPVPALLVHGADDRIAAIEPVRRWASHSPAIEFREFGDAGHDLLHEPVRHEVHSLIIEFVRRTRPGRTFGTVPPVRLRALGHHPPALERPISAPIP